MGMARLAKGFSPRRSEVIPTTAPVPSMRAPPPKAVLAGDTTNARSSMYSQGAT
jgi:hypothetical protein